MSVRIYLKPTTILKGIITANAKTSKFRRKAFRKHFTACCDSKTVAPLVATISFAVEAERHGRGWKKSIVAVTARLTVSGVTINNISVISQSAKRLERVAHTDHRKR